MADLLVCFLVSVAGLCMLAIFLPAHGPLLLGLEASLGGDRRKDLALELDGFGLLASVSFPLMCYSLSFLMARTL
jgi:hypothetical protein